LSGSTEKYHDKPQTEWSKTKFDIGANRAETVLRRCMIHPADSAQYLMHIGTQASHRQPL